MKIPCVDFDYIPKYIYRLYPIPEDKVHNKFRSISHINFQKISQQGLNRLILLWQNSALKELGHLYPKWVLAFLCLVIKILKLQSPIIEELNIFIMWSLINCTKYNVSEGPSSRQRFFIKSDNRRVSIATCIPTCCSIE